MSALDLTALPKTELHLHLEGAIPPAVFLSLIHGHGGEAEVPDAAALRAKLRYRHFDHFLRMWKWMAEWIRTPDDFRAVARGVAENLRDHGVVYAELHFSPPDFLHHGVLIGDISRAVRRGFEDVDAGPDIGLIFDLCREIDPQRAAGWVEEVGEVATEAGIIGIGLGGPEHLVEQARFASHFARAEALGLRRFSHAGEAAGAPSIWSALNDLGAERLGHGTRCLEDPALVEHLRERAVPLEVCPTSNVCTGVVSDFASHPIREFLDAGLRVTLSSDDPTFFGTSIVGEYERLRSERGFTDDELVSLARAGFEIAGVEVPESLRSRLASD